MLSTRTVQQKDVGLPGVYAFTITGAVDRDDMAAMAEHMLAAFETRDEVDMLLIFETEKSGEPGASLSVDALKAQFKSLTNVRNYVVANPPGQAGSLVETMGKVMPLEARAFDDERAALDWLRSQPPLPVA